MDAVAADPDANPRLVLVNGAQAGATSDLWADPDHDVWDEVDFRLDNAGLTPAQVQVAWMKQAQAGHGAFPDKPLALKNDLVAIVQTLHSRYPNLRLAYLAGRTRSFLYDIGLSPEPTAFETGFAVRWLIEDQINGDPGLNFDPSNGPVQAPYLSWGAYLWIDGLNPRSDGRVWTQDDLIADCTHPSTSGREKVADMLMEFFKGDSTTAWFLEGGVSPPSPTPTPPPYRLFLPSLPGGSPGSATSEVGATKGSSKPPTPAFRGAFPE
jgi:hypothetical protein